MSTPASQALSGTPATAAAPGANQPFFDSWLPSTDAAVKEDRDWIANKNFPDPRAFVKSARELEGTVAGLRSAAALKGYPTDTVNTDGTVVKADQNAVKAWRTAVGVPETPDKYDLKLPSTNPYPQFVTYLQSAMHEAGVPAAMAPTLAKGYEAAVQKLEAEVRVQEELTSKQALLELERTWGKDYQERAGLAARGWDWLAKQAGLTDAHKRAMESILGTDKFMTTLWQFGANNKEGSFAGGPGTANVGGFQGGPSAAQAKYDDIQRRRASGEIKDHEWKSTYEQQSVDLINEIVKGNPK